MRVRESAFAKNEKSKENKSQISTVYNRPLLPSNFSTIVRPSSFSLPLPPPVSPSPPLPRHHLHLHHHHHLHQNHDYRQ